MNLRLIHVLIALLIILIIVALATTMSQCSTARNACAIECAEKGYAGWLIAPVSGACECRGGKA